MFNKKWYTLIEFIIALAIMTFIVSIFFYVVKSTVIFVALKKQEITVLDNVNMVKAKINDTFVHDRVRFLYFQDTLPNAHSWVFAVKDNFLDFPTPHLLDVLAFEYEDFVYSWGTSESKTWVIAIWIVDKKKHQLIDIMSHDDWFFAIKYLSWWENISDYYSIFWWTWVFDDYINTSININQFRYDYIPNWTWSYSDQWWIMRVYLNFDNDIDWAYKKSWITDEYYFSGSTYIVNKLDLKKVE